VAAAGGAPRHQQSAASIKPDSRVVLQMANAATTDALQSSPRRCRSSFCSPSCSERCLRPSGGQHQTQAGGRCSPPTVPASRRRYEARHTGHAGGSRCRLGAHAGGLGGDFCGDVRR
jgi:hypothetical protein